MSDEHSTEKHPDGEPLDSIRVLLKHLEKRAREASEDGGLKASSGDETGQGELPDDQEASGDNRGFEASDGDPGHVHPKQKPSGRKRGDLTGASRHTDGQRRSTPGSTSRILTTFRYPDDDDKQANQLSTTAKQRHDWHIERIKDAKLVRKLRSRLASRIFTLAKWWMRCVVIVVVASGVRISFEVQGVDVSLLNIPGNVLVALIAATGVLGLLGIVLKNLFPLPKGSDDNQG